MKPASFHASFSASAASLASVWPTCLGMVVATSLGGCDVSLFREVVEVPTTNSCDSDADCGSAGQCIDSMCQTDATDIEALLLEVTPTAGGAANQTPLISGLAFTSFIEEFEQGPSGYEITLDHVSVVEAAIRLPNLREDDCLADPDADAASDPPGTDGSVPARITMTPRQRLLGLSNPTFTAQIDSLSNLGDGETGYRVGINVPPGQYDIYVEPAESIRGCLFPPVLLINQEIPSGDVTWQLEMPVPHKLGVTVRYPRALDDLKDWVVDVVQKDSGRRLSTRAVLGEPVEREGALEYDAQLVFSSGATSPAEIANELVRLSPPELVVAPTVYIERSLIDLFQDGTGLIDQLTNLADPITYSARVTVDFINDPAPSTVTFVATELETSAPGIVAGFSRSVETDANGFFDVELLPGTYTVLTEPFDPLYERRLTQVIVSDAATSQTGLTIELHPRSTVSGRVASFGDSSSVFGAAVVASSAPNGPRPGVIQLAQGVVELLPASVGDTTAQDGTFSVLADAGTFHLSARPDPTTGFSWGVRLGLEVSETVDIGDVVLPLPVVVEGRLLSEDTGGIVPGALIRAFALLNDGVLTSSLEEADSVVAVAESRVDDQGDFILLLPSALK